MRSVVFRAPWLVVLLLVLGLAGCASNKSEEMKHYFDMYTQQYFDAMNEAKAAYADGNTRKAIKLYKKAAGLISTQPEPWYRIAYINFERHEYGRAITGARETLKRDPSYVDAQSILTVSGLRVAIEALDYLDKGAGSGPVYQRAEKLANQMRDVLSEDALVAPQATSTHHTKTVQHHERATSKEQKSVPLVPYNPFQSL